MHDHITIAISDRTYFHHINENYIYTYAKIKKDVVSTSSYLRITHQLIDSSKLCKYLLKFRYFCVSNFLKSDEVLFSKSRSAVGNVIFV